MAYFVLMNFQSFLKENNVAFVKATNSGNGLNFRTQEGKLVGTMLLNEIPAEEEVLGWIKERLQFDCRTQESNTGNLIVTVSKPRVVDHGLSLAGLFDEPKAASKSKKVKA